MTMIRRLSDVAVVAVGAVPDHGLDQGGHDVCGTWLAPGADVPLDAVHGGLHVAAELRVVMLPIHTGHESRHIGDVQVTSKARQVIRTGSR